MKQYQKTTSIGCTLLAALGLACSGEPDVAEPAMESEVSPGLSGSPEPVDMEALMSAEVTSEEAVVLEDYYARAGRPTSTAGRLLRWDDATLTVDDVLGLVDFMGDSLLVDKGYANTGAASPNPADVNKIRFFRPDIFKYFVIVENNVPSAISSALGSALSDWTGRAIDCMGSSSFEVISRSAYNALTQEQRDVAYEIEFFYIPKTPGWKCGGNTGCAAFPSTQSIKATRGGPFVNRFAFGKTIHLDSNTFTAANATTARKFLRHEIGHAIGFDHQAAATSLSSHYIPGTALCGNSCNSGDMYASVMRQNSTNEFSDDDTKSLRTLYADEPNRTQDECAYTDSERLLAKLP